MVIVLEKHISAENKETIRAFLTKNHFRVNEINGDEDTIFGAVGKLGIDPRTVEVLPGIARVIPISKPYKMASREFKKDNTIIEIPNNRGEIIRVGGSKVVSIAGPCAVESREQMMSIARHVAASGAVMLRGGAFKPRTSPYSFQGLGEQGVKLLKEAGDAYGLPVVSEIVSTEHIPLMRDYIDVFQIGARNMQNFELLKRVGELGKPVVLKRGLAATIEELLMAAEYLLSSGTDNVILCERGIRTYEQATRNTLDLSAIPVLRSLTHLPVIVDPSHAVGIRDKIPPMGLAAIAAGADGIIVEVHCDPDKSMSDAAQALYPEQFDKLMRDIDVLAPVVGKEVARIRKSFELKGEGESLPPAPSQALPVSATPPSSAKAGSGKPICAFMGSAGAYADQALNRFFAGAVDKVSFPSFRDTFRSVSEGSSDYAVIPIENSLAGSVYDNYDNLSRFEDISIVGAIMLRIEHSLLAVPGATLEGIKNVYSHPHGFPQCTDFLEKRPDWKLVEAESTATAALLVSQKGSVENAAIASELAARYYNLIELAQGIESNKRNYTRFMVIAHEDAAKIGGTDSGETTEFLFSGDMTKASVIFTTKNKPGALYECLGVFHNLNLNLTRLESRPVHGAPWQHSFYADIDISGKAGNENAESADGIARAKSIVEEALAELKTKTESIRLLGLYRERDC
jgi:3-deoxy-7-phosphoheptulonate synthase